MDRYAIDRNRELNDWGVPEVFRERFPWIGGDLQTLRNYVISSSADLSPWPARRFICALPDDSGDELVAELHENRDGGSRAPVVLIHGLTGCADSSYIRNSSRVLLETGHSVVRLNLRGAGPTAGRSRFQYHAGRSTDLRDFLVELLARESLLCASGLHLVGYSLGANMTLKFLADFGGNFPVLSAASVSAPIDLKATQLRMAAPRNRLYHDYLLRRMKAETSMVLLEKTGLSGDELQALRRIYDYDDCVVAPANGFEGADDYYRRCSAGQFLAAIETPTLLIHAANDPWIPEEIYEGAGSLGNPRVKKILLPGGGHVGFHARGTRTAWHDLCLLKFFEEI